MFFSLFLDIGIVVEALKKVNWLEIVVENAAIEWSLKVIMHNLKKVLFSKRNSSNWLLSRNSLCKKICNPFPGKNAFFSDFFLKKCYKF